MLNRAQALGTLLERLIVLYERCFEILDRERTSLVTLDFANVLEVVREKDEVLCAIRALDKDRLKYQDDFALVMDIPPQELTLKLLAEKLVEQGADAAIVGQRLLRLRSQLKSLIDALGERIKSNNYFVEKSIKNLQEVAAQLSSTLVGTNRASAATKSSGVYTGKAKIHKTGSESGTIVEKRF